MAKPSTFVLVDYVNNGQHISQHDSTSTGGTIVATHIRSGPIQDVPFAVTYDIVFPVTICGIREVDTSTFALARTVSSSNPKS